MRTFLLSVLVGACVGFGTFMGTDMGTDAGDESQRFAKKDYWAVHAPEQTKKYKDYWATSPPPSPPGLSSMPLPHGPMP